MLLALLLTIIFYLLICLLRLNANVTENESYIADISMSPGLHENGNDDGDDIQKVDFYIIKGIMKMTKFKIEV